MLRALNSPEGARAAKVYLGIESVQASPEQALGPGCTVLAGNEPAQAYVCAPQIVEIPLSLCRTRIEPTGSLCFTREHF
jgi:hypothetical protein